MKYRYVILTVLIFVCTKAFCESKLFWQAVKGATSYSIAVWTDIEDAQGVYVKGPLMADYELFDVKEGSLIGWRMQGLTIEELNSNSQGAWLIKVIFPDSLPSISSFAISGGVYDNEFPPVPTITHPQNGDTGIIAEDCLFTWSSNGANLQSSVLTVQCGGEDFSYVENSGSGAISLDAVEWDPGWLEQGAVYMKIGYWVWMMPKRTLLSNVSGTVVSWDGISPYTVWLTGDRVEFEVNKSADLNGNGVIDFSDFAIIAALWLESK